MYFEPQPRCRESSCQLFMDETRNASEISTSCIAKRTIQDNKSPSGETLAEASSAVVDMAATVTEHGARLDDASAESLVSVRLKE